MIYYIIKIIFSIQFNINNIIYFVIFFYFKVNIFKIIKIFIINNNYICQNNNNIFNLISLQMSKI